MNGNMLGSLLVGGSDFKCPRCYIWLGVDWHSEYGDPMDGDLEITCPSCDEEFKLTVDTTTVYIPQLN